MKVVLKEGVDRNNSPIHQLEIDEQEMAYVHDLSECPEDACIGRDLIDGNEIIYYIQKGFDAAKRGEELHISYEDLKE